MQTEDETNSMRSSSLSCCQFKITSMDLDGSHCQDRRSDKTGDIMLSQTADTWNTTQTSFLCNLIMIRFHVHGLPERKVCHTHTEVIVREGFCRVSKDTGCSLLLSKAASGLWRSARSGSQTVAELWMWLGTGVHESQSMLILFVLDFCTVP